MKCFMVVSRFLLAAFLHFALHFTGSRATISISSKNIIDTLTDFNVNNAQFNTLLGLLADGSNSCAAAVSAMLTGTPSVSLFAPTDAAFLNYGTLDSSTTCSFLYYHTALNAALADPSLLPVNIPVVINSNLQQFQGSAAPQVIIAVKDIFGMVRLSFGGLHTASILKSIQCTASTYLHLIDTVMTIPPSLTNALILFDFLPDLSFLSSKNNFLQSLLDIPAGLTLFIPDPTTLMDAAIVNYNAQDTATALNYHVVVDESGAIYTSNKFVDGFLLRTLQGTSIEITVNSGKFYANGLLIETTDIILENGIAHVISGALSLQGNSAIVNGTLRMNGTQVAALDEIDLPLTEPTSAADAAKLEQSQSSAISSLYGITATSTSVSSTATSANASTDQAQHQ